MNQNKKTMAEWIADRPKTAEEWQAFKIARDEEKRDAVLAHLDGKTITGTFVYNHSKSGDINIYLNDGSWLHICAGDYEIHVRIENDIKQA